MNDPYWIRKNRLAGSSFPHDRFQVERINNLQVRHIINLTSTDYRNKKWFPNSELHRLSIEDFSTPTKDIISHFFTIAERALERKEAILVHCMAGCGRTGTMLALWLMKFEKLSANVAIETVRKVRICALETNEQVAFVKNFKV